MEGGKDSIHFSSVDLTQVFRLLSLVERSHNCSAQCNWNPRLNL